MTLPTCITYHSAAILAPYRDEKVVGIIVTKQFADICEYIELLTSGEFGTEYYIDVDTQFDRIKNSLIISEFGTDRLLWVIKYKE